MYLKRVEIQGFKSFPDQVNIAFDQGVTAIVGPNGSGKSNISDAVLWVLGEQSAKTLRGEKMEDVIFSGTQSRNPVGFAQVTLVLDNRQRMLPLPFDEVSVMRRVYRSGESEYKINQKACRLKDIAELFMDTGVGRDGYSMVGQGKIDSILSSKPEERRQIFEEAAGVSKYRYKKEEAQRKLKSTRENLVRIHDIVLELEAQVGPLSRQRKKALEYLEHKENLKALEVSVALDSIDRIKGQIEQGALQLADALSEQAKAQTALEAGQMAQQAMYDRMQKEDEQAEGLRAQVLGLTRSLGEYRQDIALFERELEHLAQEDARVRGEIEQEKQAAETGRAQLAELTSKYEAYCALCNEAQETYQRMQAEFDGAFASSGQEEQLFRQLEEKLAQKQQVQLETKGRISALDARLDGFAGRREELSNEIDHSAAQLAEAQSQKAAAQEAQEAASAEWMQAQHAFQEMRAKREQLTAEIDVSKARLSKHRAQQQALDSRLSMLKHSQADLEGLSFAARKVLEAQKQGKWAKGDILGALPMLLKTDSQYSTALEVALGAHNQSIVTRQERGAKEAIAFLKENKFGRVTFLPLDAVKAGRADFSAYLNMPGAIAAACDLVRFDAEIQNAVEYCLGRTLVVDTVEHAFAIAKQSGHKIRIVTLGGELLSPGGSVSGGSAGKSAGVLLRRAQEAKLEEDLQEVSRLILQEEQVCRNLQDGLVSLEEELKTQGAVLSDAEKRQKAAGYEADRLSLAIQGAEQSLERAKAKQHALEAEENGLFDDKRGEETALQAVENELEVLREEISGLQETVSGILKKREEYNRELFSQKLSLESMEKDRQHAYEQRLTQEAAQDARLKAISEKEMRLLDRAQRAEEIRADIAFKAQQMQGIDEECREKESEIQNLMKNRSEASQEILQAQETVSQITKDLLEAQKKAGEAQNSQEKLEAQLEDVFNHLWEEYELTYSSALALKKELGEQEGATLKISKIKSLIKNLGNINLDAIEQYQEVKQRYDFLTGQEKDLEQAALELMEMAKTMTKTMEKLFRENFQKISERFSSVFQQLFGGGHGELRLSDPEHVLESPIEIIVQPKGKRLQNISLLSGGEKALGAIAILFSILHVKPTPFCIFDEIEAALDDTNVDRFASYIHKFTDFTQFVVITHRRGTMEAADILFGVTMQEKGVSQLLPLNLSDLAKKA